MNYIFLLMYGIGLLFFFLIQTMRITIKLAKLFNNFMTAKS